jgi:hypothetical protein
VLPLESILLYHETEDFQTTIIIRGDLYSMYLDNVAFCLNDIFLIIYGFYRIHPGGSLMKVLADLPEILTANHIAKYLGISRRRVYELFQLHPDKGGILNFDIGFSKRVHKDDFMEWIHSKKEEKKASVS